MSQNTPQPLGQNIGQELAALYDIVLTRVDADPEASTTAALLNRGSDACALRVIEEITEVQRALRKETEERQIEEAADLLYMLMVYLVSTKIDMRKVLSELASRRK